MHSPRRQRRAGRSELRPARRQAPAPAPEGSGSPGPNLANVVVGVITFRRPRGLAALLEGIASLRFGAAAPELSFVIVDNDPTGSAQPVCEAAANALPGPVRYDRETRRGLSFARNRAVGAALEAGAEYFAFVDDDEVPRPDWLDELLRVAREHRADVVAGRVIRNFELEPPDWVSRGRFFVDPRLPTGSSVRVAAAGNVLVSRRVLTDMDTLFDPRFALSGGEDTHFFLRVSSAGYRMVWADDAIVEERVPAERTGLRWILRRAYRLANTWSLCERELSPEPGVIGARVVKVVGRLALGATQLASSPIAGRHIAARGLWNLAFAAGNVTGLLGLRFAEYAPPAGRCRHRASSVSESSVSERS